jgi:pimeloyl-ACP methyl ester carboxylesterase
VRKLIALTVTQAAVSLLLPSYGAVGGALGDAPVATRQCFVQDFPEAARCVSIEVPLDWTLLDGARLRVEAAIVPAVSGRPKPDPMIVLAGGPGQAATDYGALIDTAFRDVRKHRDIVLFDQRGTGLSGALRCELPSDALTGFETPAMRTALQACGDRLGSDAAFYTLADVVRDLEALRVALGWERVNLWGGSFGTRTAQHYVRAYGSHVRSVVLDGAISVATPLFLKNAETAQAALTALADACADDAACGRQHPVLLAEVDALLAGAAQARSVALADPRTGRPVRIEITRDRIAQSIRGALYVPSLASALPRTLTAATRGDFAPLLALDAQVNAWSLDTMALPVTLSVLCSEEMHRQTAQQADAAGTGFTGDSYYRWWAAACDAWPHRALPPEYAGAFDSDVPTLVLSGARDPVTPAAAGAATAAQFRHHTHLVVAEAAHGVSSLGCMPGLIGSFFERASGTVSMHAVSTTSGGRRSRSRRCPCSPRRTDDDQRGKRREAFRRRHRVARDSASARVPARSRRSSAPTAPARRRRCACSPASCGRTRAACRWLATTRGTSASKRAAGSDSSRTRSGSTRASPCASTSSFPHACMA